MTTRTKRVVINAGHDNPYVVDYDAVRPGIQSTIVCISSIVGVKGIVHKINHLFTLMSLADVYDSFVCGRRYFEKCEQDFVFVIEENGGHCVRLTAFFKISFVFHTNKV